LEDKVILIHFYVAPKMSKFPIQLSGGIMAYISGMWRLLPALILLLAAAVMPQESLQESLQEEGDFYNNFGVSGYSKKEIEQQKIPYYDNFGKHIVNGYLIYGLETERNTYYDSDGKIKFTDPESKTPVSDSTVNAYSNMFQTSLVSENFNNLIIAKDGLGDMKSVFLIGSQIQTRFTPLTMNKLNFQGIRWDIWTPALKFTTLLSRTRPFVMSQNDVSSRSYISYDRTDMKNWQGVKSGELLPDEDYIRKTWADNGQNDGRLNGWMLNYDMYSDFSNKSIYGDYDILWGLHGKTNIANVADVGITYLNHHRSDIKKGENIFSGDVPDDYAPEEIHFEIYDLTPNNGNDLGAKVDKFKMLINGEDVGLVGNATYYSPSDNRQLIPASSNIEIKGPNPLIAVFNINTASSSEKIGGIKNVKRIDFEFTVSGNYIVFVSTDKMVAMGYSATRRTGSNEVDIDGPFTRKVEALAQEFTPVLNVSGGQTNAPIGGAHVYSNQVYERYGNSWFGDYIAKSPRILFTDNDADNQRYYETTKRTYKYNYSINVSSETFGIDFKGKALGFKFNGEVAVNKKVYKYPGGETFDPVYRPAGYLRFDRDIIPNLFAVSGMVYNVAAEYDPAMDLPVVSQYFSYSRLYTRYDVNKEYGLPDYLYYPQHFNNNFHMLDCNKDNDLMVENDRKIYPSDLGSGNALKRWYADGTLASYKASDKDDRKLNRRAGYTYMPNGMYTVYGDDDGVYVDRYDRNHNGVQDYKEDFLLYYTDPPIFSLDNDADNNSIWDVEDADPYPDMPNGIKVSYVLTSNGFKSQGIRGANAKMVFTPIKNLELTGTFVYEKALALDFSKSYRDETDKPSLLGAGKMVYDNGGEVSEEYQDSRSLIIKTAGRYEVVKRNLGLEYFVGLEGQYLKDNIRNDVIRSKPVEDIEYLYTDYYYQTDELRFRNAVLTNGIAGVTYNNIPNFLYNTKLSMGLTKRMALPGEFYTVRTLPNMDTTLYEFRWEPYTSSLQKRLFLVNKFDYTIKPKLDFSGWKSVLNVFNRLTLNPQYKVTWSYSSSNAVDDPREGLDRSKPVEDSTSLRLDWARYALENENVISSIPVFRAFFKIAERTEFQYGYQWKRDFDQLIKSESKSRTVHTFQVESSDNVSGYNVKLIMGMNLISNDYDILNADPLFQYGHPYDGSDTRFFIKVYAGN